jgi:hypothetical protein
MLLAIVGEAHGIKGSNYIKKNNALSIETLNHDHYNN